MKEKDIYANNGFTSIDEIINPKNKYKEDESLEERVSNKKSKKPDKNELLEEIITDKVKFFKQILEEIDSQIKDRKFLKETIIKKLDDRMCLLTTKTYETDLWGLGNNTEMDSRRSALEKEIEALAKQKTEEEQQSWKDIALLRQEHRQFSEQYRNARRRAKVMGMDD